MTKKAMTATVLVFVLFIGAFFVLNIVTRDVEFSQLENRYLQQAPQFSFSSLFSGRFTSTFETYTTDQFAFRDSWTTLKAACELATGKTSNNGVYLCEDETLIAAFTDPGAETLDKNVGYVNELADKLDVPVYFGLIPGKAEILSEMLPENAPNDSESELTEYCYANCRATPVELLPVLSAHSDEELYYRTDHHWTSLGAYYGYTAIASAMGFESQQLDTYADRRVVSESFLGTTYSSSGFFWLEPEPMETFVEPYEGLTVVNFSTGSPLPGQLYDYTKLDTKDKYSMFLGGNTPLQEIDTGVADAPSLLIIRDSYTDALVPFLLSDFSRISVLDLRYMRSSLATYIEEQGFDMVLVLYSVDNFCTDSNLFLLGL